MKSLKLPTVICFLHLLLVNELSALVKTYQINNQDLKSLLDINTNRQISQKYSPVSSPKRLRNGHIVQLISDNPRSDDNIFEKRILLNVVGGRRTSVASQKLLEWLSTAPSRELFANYGKRLSDILVSASGGHQAWFSGYGKRSIADYLSKQNVLKSDYERIPYEHIGRTIQSHPFAYKPFVIHDNFINQNHQKTGHRNDNLNKQIGLWFSATKRKKRSSFRKQNVNDSNQNLRHLRGIPVQTDHPLTTLKRSDPLGIHDDQQSRVRDYVKRLERNFQTHQAWFAGYGKRNSKSSVSRQALLTGYKKRNDKHSPDHQAWFAGYGKRPKPSFQTHQAWFAGYGKRGETSNSDHQDRFTEYGKRVNKLHLDLQTYLAGYGKPGKNVDSTHKALFARYGKRGKMVNSNHQAWFAGYGKRSNNFNSDHQARFAGYGKRRNNFNSDHQAWFAGYGKRGKNVNSDHQAWFAGYGKRTNGYSKKERILSNLTHHSIIPSKYIDSSREHLHSFKNNHRNESHKTMSILGRTITVIPKGPIA